MMKRITIDFSDCENLEDFCEAVRKEIGFFDFNGYNFDETKEYIIKSFDNTFIEIVGFEKVPQNMRDIAIRTLGMFDSAVGRNLSIEYKAMVLLDFSKCKRMDEIHEVIKTAFKFPDFYGKNLDALWDCMGDYCDNEHAVLKGLDKIPKNCDFVIEEILGVFEDVRNNNQNFTFEISEE